MALTWGRTVSGLLVVALLGLLLAGTVLAAVHYAEVIARRVGEPFGSLVLAVAVTIIEVGLIGTLMITSDGTKTTLARDTVFALMITCNGIVGISLLVATLRRKEVRFSAEGSGAALATIGTLAALSLVLPTFTVSSPGPTFTPAVSLRRRGVAGPVPAVRVHADRSGPRLLPARRPAWPTVVRPGIQPTIRPTARATTTTWNCIGPPVTNRQAGLGAVMLIIALVGVVGWPLTSPAIEGAVRDAGLPNFVVAVAIALLVLLPESTRRCAPLRSGGLQVSLNLAYGSAMASIGLTVPVIAALADVRLRGDAGPERDRDRAARPHPVHQHADGHPGRATPVARRVHLAVPAGFPRGDAHPVAGACGDGRPEISHVGACRPGNAACRGPTGASERNERTRVASVITRCAPMVTRMDIVIVALLLVLAVLIFVGARRGLVLALWFLTPSRSSPCSAITSPQRWI